MAINIQDGFNVQTNKPIDARFVFADVTARNALSSLLRYEGLTVYVIATKKYYSLINGILDANWVEGAGGGKGITIVADETARDAIATDDRFEGMIVYVTADQTNFQLQGGITNADWIEFGKGGGVLVVPDYGDLLAIDSDDRYDGLIVYVQDERENWQLRGGILDANWVNLDELYLIKSTAMQTLTASQVATLSSALVQQIVVRGQVGGGTQFSLPNPTIQGQRLLITGGSDDRTCVLPTGYLGGGLLSNIAAPGDIEFSLFKTVEFMGDLANSTWIQIGGW